MRELCDLSGAKIDLTLKPNEMEMLLTERKKME